MTVDKKSRSEQDICLQFITPAILAAGWDSTTQIRREVSFTAGQVIVKGNSVKRGKGKRADYVLSYCENFSLAVVEAKDPRTVFPCEKIKTCVLYFHPVF